MENIGRTPITEAEARNLSIDYVEIESISNGWTKGHYRTVGRLSIDTDFYAQLNEDGSFEFSYEGKRSIPSGDYDGMSYYYMTLSEESGIKKIKQRYEFVEKGSTKIAYSDTHEHCMVK